MFVGFVHIVTTPQNSASTVHNTHKQTGTHQYNDPIQNVPQTPNSSIWIEYQPVSQHLHYQPKEHESHIENFQWLGKRGELYIHLHAVKAKAYNVVVTNIIIVELMNMYHSQG